MAKQKEEILFEWVTSRAVAIQSARSFNKYGITVFPRIFAIITVFLVVLYFIFDYLFPPDPSFNLLKMFLGVWLSGIGLVFFGYFVFPWICIFDRTRYCITAQSIRIASGNNPRTLKWQDLKGYVLTESQTVPGQRDITLLTDGWSRILHLPDDGLADQIIQYIAGRLPIFQCVPVPAYPVQLTFLQKCCFGFFTILFSGAAAYFISFTDKLFILNDKNDFVPVLFFVLILLLGPGTLCSVAMFGRSFFKNKHSIGRALFLNVLGFFLSMWFGIILLLWQLKKAGGW